MKDQRLLCKIDPPLSLELASFAEPLTVILDAFHLANLREDDQIAAATQVPSDNGEEIENKEGETEQFEDKKDESEKTDASED